MFTTNTQFRGDSTSSARRATLRRNAAGAMALAIAAMLGTQASGQWIGAGAGGAGTEAALADNWTGGTVNGNFSSITSNATLSLSSPVSFNSNFAFAPAAGGISLAFGDGIAEGTVSGTGITLSARTTVANTVTFGATTVLRATGDLAIDGGAGTGQRPVLIINGPVDLQGNRFNHNAGDVTINGLITGTSPTNSFRYGFGGNAGILTLTNPNNSFANPINTGGLGSARLDVNSSVPLADAGVNSAMGAGGTINFNNSTLNITGQTGAVTSNRTINIVNPGPRLNNNGTFPLSLTGTITGSGTFSLGGTHTGTNVVSGVIASTMSLSVPQGIWRLTNAASTFTGGVNSNARLQFTSIADYGSPSSLGTGLNGTTQNNITINNGSAEFVGTTAQSSNRNFLVVNSFSSISNLSSDPAATLTLSGVLSTNTVNAATLILTGINTGANTISGTIANIGTATMSLTKSGAGTWKLTGDANTFAGPVLISGGTLAAVSLRNHGENSSLGTGGASNLISLNNGTLSFIPEAPITSNRGINVNQGGTIANDSTNAANSVTLTAGIPGLVNSGTLTLRGANTGSNAVTGVISNGTAPSLALTKVDAGTWGLLNPANSFSGTFNHFHGTVTVTKLSNGLNPSSIGSGNPNPVFWVIGGVFNGGVATLNYTGTGDSTNRLFTIGEQGSIIANNGTGPLAFTNVNSLAVAGNPLTTRIVGLGGDYTGGINTFAPLIPDFDPLADPPVSVGLRKSGAGTWEITQAQSFTGQVQLFGGTLRAPELADGGVPSSIGARSAAANGILFDGGTLSYIGGGASSNRLFTLGNAGGGFDSSGTGALDLTATGSVAHTGTANSARTLVLSGSNTGDNRLSAAIGNNGTGATSVSKSGAGTWTLNGLLTYSGNTTVTGGLLKVPSPLRPVTGSLVVTGPGAVLELSPPASSSDFTVAAEVGSISAGTSGQTGVSTVRLAQTARPSVKASVIVTGALTIDASSGFVDLGNNDLIIKGGAGSLTSVRSYIAAWVGSGVDKVGLGTTATVPFTTLGVLPNTDAFGFPQFSTFDGVTVGASDLLVKYTFLGDTNLDGIMDARDLNKVLNGWSNGLTGWDNGDTNYDGVIDGIDFGNALSAFNYSASTGTTFSDPGTGGVVPEPTALAGVLAAATMLTRRRR